MEGSCRISKGQRRSAMVAGGRSRRRWGSGGQRSMGSVSPTPSRRGGHDGGIDLLQRTTEAVKHAAAANSACGFQRSGCGGREARGGGGRTRARETRWCSLKARAAYRARHGRRGRLAAAATVVLASASHGRMGHAGPSGLKRARAVRTGSGLRARPVRNRLVFFFFFQNLFPVRKQFQRKL
jgi:hypothetical protein